MSPLSEERELSAIFMLMHPWPWASNPDMPTCMGLRLPWPCTVSYHFTHSVLKIWWIRIWMALAGKIKLHAPSLPLAAHVQVLPRRVSVVQHNWHNWLLNWVSSICSAVITWLADTNSIHVYRILKQKGSISHSDAAVEFPKVGDIPCWT